MKRNISEAPITSLPNLKKTFEVETYASGYAMGAVLMQGGRLVSYHFEIFHGEVLKKWKHYFMGKETIIHTYH
jgi:hypothetical protein